MRRQNAEAKAGAFAYLERESRRRLGKRIGGSAYWRIGVWGGKTASPHGYNDQEVLKELMMLCKRRHADTPIRFP